MALNFARAGKHLKSLDLGSLFREELGWDNYTTAHELKVENEFFLLKAVAEKRGMVAYLCKVAPGSGIPPYATRIKIERAVAKLTLQHIVIYTDGHTQIWQWVKREAGKPAAVREYTLHPGQTGEPLLQKLQTIAFTLEEEEELTGVDVDSRVRAAFDVEKITKRFYDLFKTEHATFSKFIKGIPDADTHSWYASVMLNRLMFIYFIQKKGFLGDDEYYLKNNLDAMKAKGKDRFYKEFLCPLFFKGFAQKENERSDATKKLLGKVPYLNGGLFLKHQIEVDHDGEIIIGDAAFDKLFTFFEGYRWHLDERPLRNDREINPDVLGFIFEKYINQKQMGAYYTKEDITGYISKNTIIPFLFDRAREDCPIAFEGEHSLWRLLQSDPNRYIYDAVKKGVELPLPKEIEAGIKNVSERGEWNKPAAEEYALPTEIWREVVARREKYSEVRGKLERGEVREINDLITLNLDMRQFAQDVIESSEGSELLRAFWHAIQSVSVLDPTCGSGAFLFAALGVLEPLYEACLERMETFIANAKEPNETKPKFPEPFTDFKTVLKNVGKHPNHKYFVLKSIIVNNLFGVDIMEEATEICKLRLFLKLVAQVETERQIEPLPDIDFNIRAGNTLVGFATFKEVEQVGRRKLDFTDDLSRIKRRSKVVSDLSKKFRAAQLQDNSDGDYKASLNKELGDLNAELNAYLAEEYGIGLSKKPKEYSAWLRSHEPFHWFIEFHDIMQRGGFNVIIGNPPFVEYSKVREQYTIKNYVTETCGNLYAFTAERSHYILNSDGRAGLVVPLSLVAAQRMQPLQNILFEKSSSLHISNFALRPAALFPGVMQRIAIFLASKGQAGKAHLTDYVTWYSDERPALFNTLRYTDLSQIRQAYSVPKVNNETARSALSKVLNIKRRPESYIQFKGPNTIYYHNAGGYWVKVFDFRPYYRSLVKSDKRHTTISELTLPNEDMATIYLCLLNSSLFYFFWKSLTDARHLYPSDIAMMPVPLPLPKDSQVQLSALRKKLMRAYRANSERIIYGNAEVEQFSVSPCKPIIDEIDGVLAQHYGFTDEELDFIINYDIKYRMGRDAGESD